MSDSRFSTYDPGGVLKNVHDVDSDALRVVSANSLVPVAFDRIELTYDANKNIDTASYYKDINAESIQINLVADIGGNLNSTYFIVYSGTDVRKYYVWFSVDALGVDPAVPNATGIQVDLVSNDASLVVTLAVYQKMLLDADFSEDFVIEKTGSSIKLTAVRKGLMTDIADSGTGFTFITLTQGTEQLVRKLKFTYDVDQDITSLKIID